MNNFHFLKKWLVVKIARQYLWYEVWKSIWAINLVARNFDGIWHFYLKRNFPPPYCSDYEENSIFQSWEFETALPLYENIIIFYGQLNLPKKTATLIETDFRHFRSLTMWKYHTFPIIEGHDITPRFCQFWIHNYHSAHSNLATTC